MHLRGLFYIFLLIGLARFANAQSSLLPDSLADAPDSVKCWHLRELGDQLIVKGKMPEAKAAYQQALELAQAAKRPVDIGMGYRSLGYWYQNANDYGKTLDLYHQALRIFHRHAPNRAVRVYLRIGQSYLYLKDPDKARSYFQRGLTVARQQRDTSDAVHFYGSLSIVEKDQKNYPKAIQYSQTALKLYQQQKNKLEYNVTLLNQALLYKDMGQYKTAEAQLKEVAAYSRQANDKEMLAYVDINLPNVLLPLNRLDEAEAASRRALAWINRTGVNQFSMHEEVYGHLSRIAERRGNYQQALAFYKLQMAAHDSVFNSAKNQQIAELDARYQTREQEARIQLLNESNALKDRQIWAGVGECCC
ncbi:tetratricopeptide repeat protein [Spirosoma montaniterrae]|uniref:Uncharacterized protein n=1 Tax=Spirosoma montaniterrae TaxID=1178516 RepID=A0A1P9WTE4_9BACT|nr:tetratricopeptide repeat protein [Spirosoma montaniterrae]AQG78642.1 hypothetical protein AWR27_04400 [Spirosoma montaniterrae]